MAENEVRIETSEVRESLDSIEGMERAAVKRVIPPLWFGASIPLLSGALVGVSGEGEYPPAFNAFLRQCRTPDDELLLEVTPCSIQHEISSIHSPRC